MIIYLQVSANNLEDASLEFASIFQFPKSYLIWMRLWKNDDRITNRFWWINDIIMHLSNDEKRHGYR